MRTHGAYEIYRDKGVEPAVKAHLERVIAAEYAKVPRPPGVRELRSALQGLGVDVPAVSGRGTIPHHEVWSSVRAGVPAAALPGVPDRDGR